MKQKLSTFKTKRASGYVANKVFYDSMALFAATYPVFKADFTSIKIWETLIFRNVDWNIFELAIHTLCKEAPPLPPPNESLIKLIWSYYYKALKNKKQETLKLSPSKDDPRWADGVRECRKIRKMLSGKMTMPGQRM